MELGYWSVIWSREWDEVSIVNERNPQSFEACDRSRWTYDRKEAQSLGRYACGIARNVLDHTSNYTQEHEERYKMSIIVYLFFGHKHLK